MERQSGFTLLEALVAMALLAFVVFTLLGTRTAALIDATEARNWRVARDIAEHYLTEIEAGARELPPNSGETLTVEGYPGFRYQILIGEGAIGDAESQIADMGGGGSSPTGGLNDRAAWQRERETLRRAESQGLSMFDYEEQVRQEELEERIPSEDEFEDVAVVVFFPNIRPGEEDAPDEVSLILKSRVSTMAIEGLTPERAAQIAEQRGGTDSPTGENPFAGDR